MLPRVCRLPRNHFGKLFHAVVAHCRTDAVVRQSLEDPSAIEGALAKLSSHLTQYHPHATDLTSLVPIVAHLFTLPAPHDALRSQILKFIDLCLYVATSCVDIQYSLRLASLFASSGVPPWVQTLKLSLRTIQNM